MKQQHTTMTKEEFKKIREQMGLTQEKFAHLMGYENFLSILRKEKGVTGVTRQDEIIIKFLLQSQPATVSNS